MTSAGKELAKIKAFVERLKLSSPGLTSPTDVINKVYRRYHALLIFDVAIERASLGADIKKYSREGLADASTAFFLTLVGVYKASRLSLRSAIENYLRFFVSLHGTDAGSISTVYDLFLSAKTIVPVGNVARPYIERLHNRYVELCKTSHTTSLGYMSLDVPFSALVGFDKGKFSRNIREIEPVLTQVLNLLYAQANILLLGVDVPNADYVRDVIPRTLKKALSI